MDSLRWKYGAVSVAMSLILLAVSLSGLMIDSVGLWNKYIVIFSAILNFIVGICTILSNYFYLIRLACLFVSMFNIIYIIIMFGLLIIGLFNGTADIFASIVILLVGILCIHLDIYSGFMSISKY